MANFELALLLDTLIAARNPSWAEQTTGSTYSGDPSTTGAPVLSGAGVGLTVDDSAGCITALLNVQLREIPGQRTARVYATNYVAGETYTVTVGGHAVAVVGGATWAACVVQLIAALPGVAGAAALVTFAGETSLTAGDTLRVRWKAETAAVVGDLAITFSATGAATLKCVADPESCAARVFLYRGGTAQTSATTTPSGWALAQSISGITYRNLTLPVLVAGFTRAYVEVHTVAGDAADGALVIYQDAPSTTGGHTGLRAWWGPCINEG